ncbi:MAG: hypothetical protein ACK5V3_03130 [Bdellovibrionales bacterium]
MRFFLLILCCWTIEVQALTPENLCPRRLEGIANIQIHQFLLSEVGPCTLSLHPRDAYVTLIYRDYLLTSEGLLLVFNSLAPNEGPGSHGAREFFTFPSEFKGFTWETQGDTLIIKGFGELTLSFSTQTAQLKSISNADIMVSKKVEASNRGGVEIVRSQWPFVDSGFHLGGSPSQRPEAFSTIKNAKNQSCRVMNSKIFDYSSGEAQIRDRETLAQLARISCNGFHLEAQRNHP